MTCDGEWTLALRAFMTCDGGWTPALRALLIWRGGMDARVAGVVDLAMGNGRSRCGRC